MSVPIPDLIAGEPSPKPVINFKLTQLADGVAVEAKHSEDVAWQTIIEIGFAQWGQLEVRTRDVYAKHLCEIASIAQGEGLRVIFKSNNEPGMSCPLVREDRDNG